MNKILIVEDDTYISEMLSDLLRKNGYEPTPAFSGTEALFHLKAGGFSLMVLDLMLPGKTGEEVLQEVRSGSNIPVVVLTAKADKKTTVELLRLGADDYLAKPFDNQELLARIEVQLRRIEGSSYNQTTDRIYYKDIILNVDGYEASIDNKKLDLSKKEFEILHLMASHPNKVFSKSNLYESVWGGDYLGDDNTVSVHISNLRTKMATIKPEHEYIQTVWGLGYKMK
jgi:DNA-binding response OmpR family regulator